MKKCDPCTLVDLEKEIYQSKYAYMKLTEERIKRLRFGYTCDPNVEYKLKALTKNLEVLEHEERVLTLGASPCLSPRELQKLLERNRKLTTTCDLQNRLDLIQDKSNFDTWIKDNPGCVGREEYEKWAYYVCGKLNISIIRKDLVCDLVFEITREIIPCNILLAIEAYKEACKLDLDISRTREECLINFKLLHEKVECDLDFNTYVKLNQCNVSFDIIREVYENGCRLNVDDLGEVVVESQIASYKVNDLESNINIQEYKELVGVVPTKTKETFLSEYQLNKR